MADAAKKELTEEEKAALKAEREARKKAKEAEKAAKKAAKAEAAAAAAKKAEVPKVDYVSEQLPEAVYGDYNTICSGGKTKRTFTSIGALNKSIADTKVWLRARVQSTRGVGANVFMTLRQSSKTVQAVVMKGVPKEMIKFAGGLPRESIVDCFGTVAASEVRSCTQNDVEIAVERVYIVSRAIAQLPLQVEDASRSEAEIAKSEQENPEKPYPRVLPDTRLDYRVIDLRVPAHNAIMRMSSAVCGLWRRVLSEQGFTEIHTPKLIAGASEGGAAVFKLDYMGQPACLAQSPQLYKQMAIAADLGRVFEIGPVFRAENSNTNRHLCEFTGLDMEMEIFEHYHECLDMLMFVLASMFRELSTKHKDDIELISQVYPCQPFLANSPDEPYLRISHLEAVNMLRADGCEMEDLDDFTLANERRLGVLIKEKHNTDFYTIDRFPDDCRPFYTMKCPDDPRYTNSYDIYMRGEEICSGAQRIHDSEMVKENATKKGVNPADLKAYIDAFSYGSCPHGGGGVGMERVTMLFLGIPHIKMVSMFPRDPRRLTP